MLSGKTWHRFIEVAIAFSRFEIFECLTVENTLVFSKIYVSIFIPFRISLALGDKRLARKSRNFHGL